MSLAADAAPRAHEGASGSTGPEARGAVRRGSWRLLWLLVCLGVLVGVVLASIAIGSRQIPVGVVIDALTDPSTSDDEHVVVRSLRVPRTIAGLLVGVALGLAGAVMQGVTRNPLADPGLLGVSAGASFAVVFGISILGVGNALGYIWFAFVGAAVASVVVYTLGAIGRGGATPVKLALAGAAVTSFLLSMTTAMLLMDQSTLDEYRFWAVGSIAGRDRDVLTQLAPFIVVGALMALAAGPVLNSLALGDDVARSLGSRVGLARAFAAASVVLLVGAATALAGPIGFVGLTIPHVARAITGPDYRWVLAYSMVLAPILLLGSDVIGRVVARPGELQVGIVTAVVGAPFFVMLVRRRKLAEL
ncbi:iron ABC transporter permease [Nocardioides sp.]|uniref:FecCD family ABC transporter permease n=1 Tax=Nocardioides sp. TaxID=35761 RepID=UPI001A2C548B|nr:iron ABC transporter permease [Nocardioides sp.]MBJ7358952.1 iron ABC transporter permease [Nocardioides sp.]